jgi:hypothetical protein
MKQKYHGFEQVYGNETIYTIWEHMAAKDFKDFEFKTIFFSKMLWKNEHNDEFAKKAAREVYQLLKKEGKV